jgi:glutathione S-transferase
MKLYYSKNLNPRVAVAVAKLVKLPVDFVRANPRGPKEDEEAFRSIKHGGLVMIEKVQVLQYGTEMSLRP